MVLRRLEDRSGQSQQRGQHEHRDFEPARELNAGLRGAHNLVLSVRPFVRHRRTIVERDLAANTVEALAR